MCCISVCGAVYLYVGLYSCMRGCISFWEAVYLAVLYICMWAVYLAALYIYMWGCIAVCGAVYLSVKLYVHVGCIFVCGAAICQWGCISSCGPVNLAVGLCLCGFCNRKHTGHCHNEIILKVC